ncbi:Ubiquitin-conjugating enzyme E2 6 [Coemansia nantahalensis]|uniref:Ubiquitin-conjugating enzyme E2 6 n=2 Tax=Coemansia TaxID=4863 RepID=A0ACC1L9K4_9FUNG|nr:Ubiquitin-conjugating enzyme E2 6 [Coemansia nantahalensis]KAJ2775867.1 Ubiquitin-conjugating enzyme E2 6 [Coemansia nantahalensis]KAJ2804161.1 Ubiquitin-conjugating enzyme E2 6 [Coemansia helicoidea]
MASKAAFKRLTKEYKAMQTNPPPFITAKPLEANILEWHYVLRGPPDTAYEGGEYHGRLRFPADYPYKPPAIQMITPSGRFQTNTNICMSMSNFHPDTWNPAWSVSTILSGMLSFMVEEEATTGSIRASTADRKILARKSRQANLANHVFRELFPELCAAEAAPAAAAAAAPAAELEAAPAAAVRRRTARLQPAPATAAANNHQAPAAWLPGLPRKWLVLFVVVAYFFASKAISRMLSA